MSQSSRRGAAVSSDAASGGTEEEVSERGRSLADFVRSAAWGQSQGPKVNTHQLCTFTRQFVTMIDAGLPLLRALDFYAASEPTAMGDVIRDVADNVREGQTLSKAMSRYPTVFSHLYSGLVRVGEGTGGLHIMLHKVAELLERQDKFRSKTLAAMTYPLCLLVVAFAVFLTFIFFILPALQPMLTSVNVAPPFPTQVLIFVGDFLRNPWSMGVAGVTIVCVLLFGPVAWRNLRKNEQTCLTLDRVPLEIPMFGSLINRVLVSRVLFTMATTIDSGLTITTSLDLARQVASNSYIAAEIKKVRMKIEDGFSLAESMASTTIFMEGAVQMVAVGEETSSLSSSLQFVARLYDDIAEEAIQSFASLIEPLMMGAMGFVAGFLILASILPIVRMLQSL